MPNALYVCGKTHTHTYHCVFSDTFSRSHGFFSAAVLFFFFMRRENEEASLGGHDNNPGKGLQGDLPC